MKAEKVDKKVSRNSTKKKQAKKNWTEMSAKNYTKNRKRTRQKKNSAKKLNKNVRETMGLNGLRNIANEANSCGLRVQNLAESNLK